MAIVLYDDINHVTKLMAELALGMRYLCDIMTFTLAVDERHLRVRSVCVQENMVRSVIKKYGEGWKELKNQRFEGVCVQPNGYINIYLKGNITHKQTIVRL